MPGVEDTKENFDICMQYCGSCLTYPGVEGEALYCARGKSSVQAQKKGCNCGVCDVQRKYGCKNIYHCIEGVCA